MMLNYTIKWLIIMTLSNLNMILYYSFRRMDQPVAIVAILMCYIKCL